MQIVEQTKLRSGWRVYRTLAALGAAAQRLSRVEEPRRPSGSSGQALPVYEVLPEERARSALSPCSTRRSVIANSPG